MILAIVFQLAHVLSFPVVISFDGYGYLNLSEIVGTQRFAAEWDYLRTPFFPFLTQIAFRTFGKSATTFLALQALMAFVGIWAIAAALKRANFTWAAAACFPVLAFSPVLVGYEHAVLTEVGTFLAISLLVAALLWPTDRLWIKTAAAVTVLVIGYYQRLSPVYLAPFAAILYAVWLAQRSLPREEVKKRVIAMHATVVLVVPFLAAYPWQRQLGKTDRMNDVLLYGLVKQAAIPEEAPIWGPEAPHYKQAVADSTDNGFFAIGGLRNVVEYDLIRYLKSQGVDGAAVYRDAILTHPGRIASAYVRTLASYAGLSGAGSESALFRDLAINSSSPLVLLPGPQAEMAAAQSAFTRISLKFGIGQFLGVMSPIYELMTPLSAFATVFLLVCGIRTRDFLPMVLAGIPVGFCLIHALTLNSLDRMAAPVQPLMLGAGLCAMTYMLRRSDNVDASPVFLSIRPAYVLLGVLALIGLCHVIYLSVSRQIPSADEAHYMTGVLSISEALRSFSPRLVWTAYAAALGFKAPLICVPAGIIAAITGSCIGSSMASLAMIWAATVGAAYFLFRLMLPPLETAVATLLLGTMPMVTGLTHRFYVENLLLLLFILFLLALVRWELESYRGAVLLGLVFGLGMLCKTTFALVASVPLAYITLISIRQVPTNWGDWRRTFQIVSRACALLAVAFVISWTWYGRNWRNVAEHARAGYTCDTCKYPTLAAFLVNVIAGPNIVTFAMAALALPVVLRVVTRGSLDRKKQLTWSFLLLGAAATLFMVTVSTNKATRFSITWLPALAALAAFMPSARLRSTRSRKVTLAIAAVFSILVFMHNSFAVLPFRSVSLAGVKLLDNQYPLNVPDWFDDNHPVERRDFGLDAMARFIARDARDSFSGQTATVRLAAFGLLLNHDYLNLSARLHAEAVDYLWWPGTVLSGPQSPDYILSCKGCDGIYPGREEKDYYPLLDKDVAEHRLPYVLVKGSEGPGGVHWTVYRKLPLVIYGLLKNVPGRIDIEAEAFSRGNAIVDRSYYGRTIGVIVSQVPHPYVEYDLNFTKPEQYQFELRCAAAENRPLVVKFDGKGVLESVRCGGGGWMPENQQWISAGTIYINAGRHVLRLEREGPLPHIDRLVLAPIQK